jgi:alpha-L-fucosidase 2
MKNKYQMRKTGLLQLIFLILFLGVISCTPIVESLKLNKSPQDLMFPSLARSWDEGIPLGNAMVGALVWQNGDNLRLSLDRADLWDLRPMENLNSSKWKYSWVYDQWKKDDYRPVQKQFDDPYDRAPAPSKIPAGALEFDVELLGEVESVHLNLETAVTEIKWKSGVKLFTFVHATDPVGWYRFEGLTEDIVPQLIAPAYNKEGVDEATNPVTGQDLRRLGYPKGEITSTINSTTYNQEGWGGFKYQIHVGWQKHDNVVEGCWSISSRFPDWKETPLAHDVVKKTKSEGYNQALDSHLAWWKNYWGASSISLPDSLLEKQWYLEIYKFGAAARKGAPPISLQAVWTADNGKLPPWKGDFHHDLNTQLSYWPAYSSNHLQQEEGYLDWLGEIYPEAKKYTKEYFQSEGLAVPGVSTLTGKPMGGWIQYAFSPTASAWLGQHFYLHWRYSMDREFLKNKAYPWIKEVAILLDDLSVKDAKGLSKLPISSSPEIFNNSREAWFDKTTNYDLGLIRWTFEKAGELARELGKDTEAAKWDSILAQWPYFDVDPKSGLTFAPGVPYNNSHRHFSHLMGFHPMGLIDWSNGEKDQEIIKKTLANLELRGSDWWTGYSFSWLGNLHARAFDGDKAADALRTFASCFCLSNSFHANGDQSGTGKSKFTYRPFTLEGNFAFASGIQEMLIQSHTKIVRLFPAIPHSWKDVSFDKLRTEGAFLVSAQMKDGLVDNVEIISEMGGELRFANPFNSTLFATDHKYEIEDGVIIITMEKGGKLSLERKQ